MPQVKELKGLTLQVCNVNVKGSEGQDAVLAAFLLDGAHEPR
jgi:hypothetical protein